MSSSNKNSKMKQQIKAELTNETTLNQQQINSSTVGAVNSGDGTMTVHGNIKTEYHKHVYQQQSAPTEQPRDIELDVIDAIATFRGRGQEFAELKEAFDNQKGGNRLGNAYYNLVAICGYGGIGKTQFSRKYIQMNRQNFENILWIHAESDDTMKDSFHKLQRILRHKGYSCESYQDVYEHLNNDKTLFIFDNAKHIRNIQSFLPGKPNNSRFLATSKATDWKNCIGLNKLNPTDALEIMKAVLEDNGNMEDISDSELEIFTNIFEAIPLVLQIKAGYLCDHINSFKHIGVKFNFAEFKNQLDTEVINKTFPDNCLDPYTETIFEALAPTLEKIWKNGEKSEFKTAMKILKISAYLNSDYIYIKILQFLLDNINTYEFTLALSTLHKFLLIHTFNGKIQIHRTVQECIRQFLPVEM